MIRYFLISLSILCADQLSKKMILHFIAYQEQVPVFIWLDIVHIHNRGAAFSLFASAQWSNNFLLVFGVLAIVVLSWWLWKWSHHETWLNRLALAFILGGAYGNVADRIQFGFVIDFISVHYKHWYYPSFNIADAAISVGAAMILFSLLRTKQRGASKSAAPSERAEEDTDKS